MAAAATLRWNRSNAGKIACVTRSNIEYHARLPLVVSFLDTKLMKRDCFYVGTLLVTAGIQLLARDCGLQRILTVILVDLRFSDAQQELLCIFEEDQLLQ